MDYIIQRTLIIGLYHGLILPAPLCDPCQNLALDNGQNIELFLDRHGYLNFLSQKNVKILSIICYS